MHPLPRGDNTFLLTDIEGFSRQVEQEPAAAALAVASHNEIIERAVARHGGRVVRSRLEGDSYFCVFTAAPDAVAAALDAQRDLLALTWPRGIRFRVRMGIHTGQAQLLGDDYLGDAVNRCSRVRDAASGGQVLVTGTTRALVAEHLPDAVTLEPLGAHRLRGLANPVEVFQLRHPDLPADFPPLLTDTQQTNLTEPLVPLVGRDELVTSVCRAVEHLPLVTLVGPGGIGKTRLAIAAGLACRTSFVGGVWFVDLAHVDSPELVVHATGHTLGLREEAGVAMLDQIAAHVRRMPPLIILDNCEHVLFSARAVVESLLAACPGLHVLTTTREALGIPGEHVIVIPPLATLDDTQVPTVTTVRRSGSGRLFEARAREVMPSYGIRPESAAAVAELCRRLEGNPLAIEIVAGRVDVLSEPEILARLSSSLDLLRRPGERTGDRHDSVASAIAWSHRLLPDREQRLLGRLAVFAGGFDLHGAEAVGPAADVAVPDVLNLLSNLLRKSLVQVDLTQSGGRRFRMAETVRRFLVDRADPDELHAAHAAHAEHYGRLAAEAEPALRGRDSTTWLTRLDAEHDNCRQAVAWLAEQDAVAAQLLAGRLWFYWYTRGHHWTGRAILRGALAAATDHQNGEARLARALALHGLGTIAYFAGDLEEAQDALTKALALREAEGDDKLVAYSLNNLAMVLQSTTQLTVAREMYERSLALKQAAGDPHGVAVALLNIANLNVIQGQLGIGLPQLVKAEAMCRELGDQSLLANVLSVRTEALHLMGAYEEERRLVDATLALHEALGDEQGLAEDCMAMGRVVAILAGYPSAERWFRQSCDLFRRLGSGEYYRLASADLALALARCGQPDAALAILDEGGEMGGDAHTRVIRAQTYLVRGHIRLELGQWHGADEAFRAALDLLLPDRWPMACQAIDGLACVAAVTGEPARAVTLAAAVEQQLTVMGCQRTPPDAATVGRFLARAAAPTEVPDQVRQRGATMSADELVLFATQAAEPA